MNRLLTTLLLLFGLVLPAHANLYTFTVSGPVTWGYLFEYFGRGEVTLRGDVDWSGFATGQPRFGFFNDGQSGYWGHMPLQNVTIEATGPANVPLPGSTNGTYPLAGAGIWFDANQGAETSFQLNATGDSGGYRAVVFVPVSDLPLTWMARPAAGGWAVKEAPTPFSAVTSKFDRLGNVDAGLRPVAAFFWDGPLSFSLQPASPPIVGPIPEPGSFTLTVAGILAVVGSRSLAKRRAGAIGKRRVLPHED